MPVRLSDLRKTADAAIDADGLYSAQVTTIAQAAGLSYLSTLDSLPTSSLTSGDQAFVAANQRLYISNGTGWYNVSLINLTPQFDSDISSTFSIVDSQTPLIITNPASDSDNPDAIITYGGTLSDSGQYLIALTRDSSVWTFTPLSADSVHSNVTLGNLSDSNGGDFTYTFTATDGINTATKAVTITYDGLATSASIGLGSTAGYIAGGYYTDYLNQIQKISFASDGNAADAGDLLQAHHWLAGNHSLTHGYISGGFGPAISNVIQKFQFATDGDMTDVGDTVASMAEGTGNMSPTDGYISSGRYYLNPSVPTYSNMIQKFSFASDGNATDHADLNTAGYAGAGQSSSTHGYKSGGFNNPSPSPNRAKNEIDKFPFANNSNATDVGDLVGRRFAHAGAQSTTHGYVMGGTPPVTQTIQKFTFASDANATSVGNITVEGRYYFAGNSSTTHGYTTGGRNGPGSIRNYIDKFPFASDTNAADVGDINHRKEHEGNMQV